MNRTKSSNMISCKKFDDIKLGINIGIDEAVVMPRFIV